MKQKLLVLFSGTGSLEKVFEKKGWECRGLDIDNKFKPYYHQDILSWDYKEELKNWTPDYIHSSFVCCEFSNLKITYNHTRNLELGYSLLNKSLEIIDWVKSKNPNLKITLENPRNPIVENYEPLKKYKRCLTSYCKYGFPYNKPTFIWYDGFDLKLEPLCTNTKDNKKWCESKKDNNGIHKVRIGFTKSGDRDYSMKQISSSKYTTNLHKEGKYIGYRQTHILYRIPEGLIEDIYNCFENEKKN